MLVTAGDVFDSVNPPARAEEMFYWALERIAQRGRRPVIVLAGNHDNPERLRASDPLARSCGIYLYGVPAEAPYPVRIPVPAANCDLSAAVLPYPSERRLNQVLTERADEEVMQQAYAAKVQAVWEYMDSRWQPGCVRIAAAHVYMAGGEESGSERPIQVGGAYTVPKTILPSQAQYMALGHLHRPQALHNTSVPARYAGSPLCYSFSEAGQTKSVTLVDVRPEQQPKVEDIPLSCGRPLVRWQADSLEELQAWTAAPRDPHAWVDVEVHLCQALTHSEIQSIRQAHRGILHIRPVFPATEGEQAPQAHGNQTIDQAFRRFYEQKKGVQPSEAVVKMFLAMLETEGEDH